MGNLPGTRIVTDGETARLDTSEWRGLTLQNMTWIELILKLLASLRDHTYGVLFQGNLSGDLLIDKDCQIRVALRSWKYNIRISLEEDSVPDSEGSVKALRLKVQEIDKKTGKSSGVNIQLQDNVIAYIIREMAKMNISEQAVALIESQERKIRDLEDYMHKQAKVFISYIDRFYPGSGLQWPEMSGTELGNFMVQKAQNMSDDFAKALAKIHDFDENTAQKFANDFMKDMLCVFEDSIMPASAEAAHDYAIIKILERTRQYFGPPLVKAHMFAREPTKVKKNIEANLGLLTSVLLNSASPELVKAYEEDNTLQKHYEKAAQQKQQQSGEKSQGFSI